MYSANSTFAFMDEIEHHFFCKSYLFIFKNYLQRCIPFCFHNFWKIYMKLEMVKYYLVIFF